MVQGDDSVNGKLNDKIALQKPTVSNLQLKRTS